MPGAEHVFFQGTRRQCLWREVKELKEAIYNKEREHVDGTEVMINE